MAKGDEVFIIRNEKRMLIGWREWVSLPELGIEQIKAKIDTGARTSALHAFKLETFKEKGKDKVRFSIHPKQGTTQHIIHCSTDLIDFRWIMDSGGHRERRYVICTPVVFGKESWPVEITLTRRDDLRFRMLLGRTSLNSHFLIDTDSSYLLKKYYK